MEEVQEHTERKVEIPSKASVKLYWHDKPINYSIENKSRIKDDFSKKYGINKKNIKVIYKPVEVDKDGNTVELSNTNIDNVMDINHQRNLFKQWLELENKDVDYDRLIELDDQVNAAVNYDFDNNLEKQWKIKKLEINNFLCFGEDNIVDFDQLRGLVVVNSDPENYGGKTTFSLDAIKFLLFGSTTKTMRNVENFNSYTDGKTLLVKGHMEIENEDFVIERKMTRSQKTDGSGEWVVRSNKINYYRIMPDGQEEEMSDEDVKKTKKLIEDAVGRESDFESTVLATSKNLEDLIDSSPSENGKLLNRFIGLEVLFDKESQARKLYNEFAKTMKANHYDVPTLQEEIQDHSDTIEKYNELLKEKNNELENIKEEIQKLNNKKTNLSNSKKAIDEDLKNINIERLEKEIEDIKEKGKTKKQEKENLEHQISQIGEVDFNEERHNNLNKELNELKANKKTNESEIERLNSLVEELREGEICPTCKRPLEDVDHSDEINKNLERIENKKREVNTIERKIEDINNELKELEEKKEEVERKNKLELQKEKFEADLTNYRNELKEKQEKHKKYKENLDYIEKNKEIENEINGVQGQIELKEGERDKLNREIQRTEDEITNNQNEIQTKNDLIDQIRKEEEQERIYKTYIEMLGKKGISKLVVRSVLPIINSELTRLLDDVCDFSIEMDINHKNEVQFFIHKDGVVRNLRSASGFERTASGLAIRCVLGKISNLPTPNFLVFDEVLGKVAGTNMEYMKELFDKISEMYETVFFITHESAVKDWADDVLTIVKNNNISSIQRN